MRPGAAACAARQEAGDLPPDLDLDVAIDLIWDPLMSRWLQRSGPLAHAYADQAVERALRGPRAPLLDPAPPPA